MKIKFLKSHNSFVKDSIISDDYFTAERDLEHRLIDLYAGPAGWTSAMGYLKSVSIKDVYIREAHKDIEIILRYYNKSPGEPACIGTRDLNAIDEVVSNFADSILGKKPGDDMSVSPDGKGLLLTTIISSVAVK